MSMHRIALLSAALLLVSGAPAAAACYWSNGVYKCSDRSGRAKPQPNPNWQERRMWDSQQWRTYPPNDTSSVGGGISYSSGLFGRD
jgi:hypothetical protein